MESSLHSDLQPVWTVRSRRSLAELEFWLIIIGYDIRTHSFNSKGYLFYVILFFSVWIFSVLTLVADFAGRVLLLLPLGSSLQAAVWVGGFLLTLLGLVELYGATQRSPLVFSEADSSLICQTPVNRRVVALIWLLASWIERGLLVWTAAVILGYALLEAQTEQVLTTADLPRYILAGSRALLIVAPLHLCMQALAWAAGVWRLRGRWDIPSLRWSAPLLAGGLIGLAVITGLQFDAGIPAWLQPFAYPIQAGLGGAPLLLGLAAGLLWMGMGLFTLWQAAGKLSLSRAAEETRGYEAQQAVRLVGSADAANEMKQRERLGAGGKSTRVAVGSGAWAIVWRNLLLARRGMTIGSILSWLSIFTLGLGFQLIPDWGPRVVMALSWIFFFGQKAVSPLRHELRRWWLMRQLPFSTAQLALIDLAGPALAAGLLTAFSALAPLVIPIPGLAAVGWLALPIAAGVALAAGIDLLVQCKTDKLTAGNVPEVSLLMVLLGALVVGVSAAAIYIAQVRWLLPPGASSMVGVVACLGVDGLLLMWVRDLTKNMK